MDSPRVLRGNAPSMYVHAHTYMLVMPSVKMVRKAIKGASDSSYQWLGTAPAHHAISILCNISHKYVFFSL